MRKSIILLALALLVMAVGCKKDPKTPQPSVKMTKIADYLYEYEADGYSTEAPSEFLTDDGPLPLFACSAVRNGNFYGRNLDFNINEICEFVIKTKATETRKHASIGVANTCLKTITKAQVEAGLDEKLLKFIPWMMMDGINDAGLVCNINVVNMADLGDHQHKNTNPGAPKIMVMNLVRALLDNCGSVEEAKTFIENHDITPVPTSWDCHVMIADPTKTVVVEFTGIEGSEVIYTEYSDYTDYPIMTNFYNYQYEATGQYPPHACGIERYEILKENYGSSNTMEGMWNLLKTVCYTQSYKESTDPFWCSEFYDKIPTFDDYENPIEYWTKERILEQEEPKKEVEAYKVYEQTGQYSLEDGLWFTSHNSTYDIANKALWVTVREKYESRHEFTLE